MKFGFFNRRNEKPVIGLKDKMRAINKHKIMKRYNVFIKSMLTHIMGSVFRLTIVSLRV